MANVPLIRGSENGGGLRRAPGGSGEEAKSPSNGRRWDGYLLPRGWVRRAGLRPESFLAVYWLCKVVPIVLVLFAPAWAQVGLPVVVHAAALALAAFGVDLWIVLRMRKRQRRIEHNLSFFIDMISGFLRAGMGFEAAIARAIEYGLPPRSPLRFELNIVRSEILAGRARDEAFGALWNRTGVADLQTLASVFRIGFDIGVPILTVLEHQAELLRERTKELRRKRIDAKVMQAMIPLVLFNFPMMLVIVFYPPVIEFSSILFLSY